MRQFQVVPPPMFTDIRRAGTNILLDLRPTTNRLHFVQRKEDLASGSWTNFTNNIFGTSATVSVTDPGAAARPRRFYRIGLSP
jgi:hypothetical protein